MAYHEDAEFKTLDGLTIRGWLYPAKTRGPAIIITPGVSCVSIMQNHSILACRVGRGKEYLHPLTQQ